MASLLKYSEMDKKKQKTHKCVLIKQWYCDPIFPIEESKIQRFRNWRRGKPGHMN